jgi:hypothetical protein
VTPSSPFTVALCRADGCGRRCATDLLDRLRETVRGTPGGVLVTTGCLRGPLACGGSTENGGAFLVVQPCRDDGRPSGTAIPIGPIRTEEQVETLCKWLRRGRLTRPPNTLQDGLRAARLN